jgi:hypothetical protein
MGVDLQRNRIALTMKRAAAAGEQGAGPRGAERTAKPKAQTFTVPKPGAVAPNGMRFK